MKNKREYVPPLPSDFRPNIVARVCCKNCAHYFRVCGTCSITGERAKPMKLHECWRFKRRDKKK